MCTPVCRKVYDNPFRHSSKRLLHAPVSGYRERTSGALSAVGTNGYAWSSSPAAAGNTNSSFFWLAANTVRPSQPDGRAYAFPVRCVQYLQLLFQRITYICSDKAASARSGGKSQRLPSAWPQIQQSATGLKSRASSCVLQSAGKFMTILFGIHLSDCFCAPASGFRNYTTGDLTNVGGSGVYWSSAASAADNANAG